MSFSAGDSSPLSPAYYVPRVLPAPPVPIPLTDYSPP
jgi:hypothetical protein